MKAAAVIVALAVLCMAMLASAQQNSERCPGLQECRLTYTVNEFVFKFDLNPLCSDGADYSIEDPGKHLYSFNICGTTNAYCRPRLWRSQFEYGVAVQSWGNQPICPPKNCFDAYTNEPACCTGDCQVLGVGLPRLSLEDPNDPVAGGVQLLHRQMVPNPADPFICPTDPVSGLEMGRQITFHIACDKTVQGLKVLSIEANKTDDCQYHLYTSSIMGCGCTPDCSAGCGPDGCGGECPSCGAGEICTPERKCCRPSCTGVNCGDDGCGGQCGYCPGFYDCVSGICTLNTGPHTTSDGGAIAGAFFGGFFGGIIIVALGAYCYLRRRRSANVSRASAATSALGADSYGSLS